MIQTLHLVQRRLAGRPVPRLALPLVLASLAAAIAGIVLAMAR